MLDFFFFFQAEDGIRDLVRSRGLGDVYKRQLECGEVYQLCTAQEVVKEHPAPFQSLWVPVDYDICLLYTSDAADERSSVDLGGRRIIKKKKIGKLAGHARVMSNTHRCTRYRSRDTLLYRYARPRVS